MSSILKALRKLEEERARRRETAPEIATSILRVDARRKLLPLWLWPALVASGMLLAAAAFWGLRPEPHRPDDRAATAVTTATVPPPPRFAGKDAIIEEVIDTRVPAVPVAASRRAPPVPVARSGQTATVRQTPAVRQTAPSASPPHVAASSANSTLNATSAPPPAPPQAAVVPSAAHSHPVVTAIVWQEDRASRMAVVSGLPVMEGELVGAAKIVEIQVDRVVFSENGLSFSMPMKGD